MSSPVETIADALVAFILSLMNDPDAADDFVAAPQASLASNGLQGVCMADVAAARPVVVDHPAVHSTPAPMPVPPPSPPGPPTPETEIIRMIQQFTSIDARSTVVDQSVNQNIWTEGGDVTQLFDQEAVVASGDHAVAAGDDATIVDSDVDVTIDDVSIGNEYYDESFNQTGVDEAPVEDATVVEAVTAVEESTAVEEAPPVAETTVVADASVPEPADLLEADMTATADVSYDSDAASAAAASEQPIEELIEEN